MAIASCSDGIPIELTNAVEGALVEEVRGRRHRETLYGMKRFFIARDEITIYRPPPRGCNHEQRLLTKTNSLVQQLQTPHLLQIEGAIQRYIERNDIGYKEELSLRTVITDIRLFGQAALARRQPLAVRLQPRGWVACRFDVVKDARKILDEIPSTIPQNLGLGSKIEVGLSNLSWRMADEDHMPKGLTLGRGFDLPTQGYRFFLSVGRPRGNGGSRRSCCGLLCGIVLEQYGHRRLVRVCRIGGVIEILDQKGLKKLVAVTVAHGLSDYVLAATSRKTVNGNKRRGKNKATKTPGKSDTTIGPGREVPERDFSKAIWTPITGFHAINWLGNVWSPTPQHPSSISIGNIGNATGDADFTLLDMPFSLKNSFSAASGAQSITGLVMDDELLSMAETDQELSVIVEPGRILSATLLRKAPVIFIRGRPFATRIIRLRDNETLPYVASGCWVLIGNKLCGMVVASNDLGPIVYMVSAQKLFSDIEATIGQWPEIPTKTAVPALKPLQAEVSFQDRLLKSLVVSAGEGNDRHFLPQNALESLFDASSVSDYVGRSLDLRKHALPSLVNYVLRSARRLFAILILIDGCEILEDMCTEGLTDDDLPLVADGGDLYRRGLNASSETMSNLRLNSFHGLNRLKIANFDTMQWGLLAPRFGLDDKGNSLFYRLHRKVVLPWLTCDRVTETGGSTIRRVQIHPAHFDFSQASSAVEFAVKELRSLAEETFHAEMTALMKLPRHRHLNTVLASYQWRGSNFLVFPWADGNLADLWARAMPRPSVTTALVLWFLEQCAGLAEGLSIIHGTSQLSEEIYGRHGDIKPQNILWYRDESPKETGPDRMGVLKISDFGETRFHNDGTQERVTRQSATSQPGVTISYSAPELETDYGKTVSRSFDVWSLGCVYLEFIAWLLRGAQGVDDFRAARRKDAHDGKGMGEFFQMLIGVAKPQAVVKTSVTECIRSLRYDLDSHPQVRPALNGFLDLVSEEMLVVGRGRARSAEVLSTLQSLIERLRSIPRTYVRQPRSQLIQEPSPGLDVLLPAEPGGKDSEGSEAVSQSARWRQTLEGSNSTAAIQILPLERIEEEIEEVVRQTDAAGEVQGTWHRNTRRSVGLQYAPHQGPKASTPSASRAAGPDTSDFSSMSGAQLLEAERALIEQFRAINEVRTRRERQDGGDGALKEAPSRPHEKDPTGPAGGTRGKILTRMRQFIPRQERTGLHPRSSGRESIV